MLIEQFGYLNPATCLLYDFNNKSIKMFLTFTLTFLKNLYAVIQRLQVQFLLEDNFFALLVLSDRRSYSSSLCFRAGSLLARSTQKDKTKKVFLKYYFLRKCYFQSKC